MDKQTPRGEICKCVNAEAMRQKRTSNGLYNDAGRQKKKSKGDRLIRRSFFKHKHLGECARRVWKSERDNALDTDYVGAT